MPPACLGVRRSYDKAAAGGGAGAPGIVADAAPGTITPPLRCTYAPEARIGTAVAQDLPLDSRQHASLLLARESSPRSPGTVGRMGDWSAGLWLHWILRVGALWCFVGHGAFGIIGKAGWLPYYRVFGVSDSLAWDSMPIIGAIDIAIGILILVRPMRAVLVYAIFWTALTALLRPLAGQGLWQEVFERGGNYGLPLALLLLVGLGNWTLRSWFERALPRELTLELTKVLAWTLRISIALLLVGHGGFGITHLHDKEWIAYLGVLGVGPDTASPQLIATLGWFEVALGLALLVKPYRGLILFVLAWKLGTEFLRPLAGEPMWEFVERGGDYFLPIALFLVQGVLVRHGAKSEPPTGRSQSARPPPASRSSPRPGYAEALVDPSSSEASVAPSPTRPVRTTTAERPAAPVDVDDEVARAAAALVARLAARREARSSSSGDDRNVLPSFGRHG